MLTGRTGGPLDRDDVHVRMVDLRERNPRSSVSVTTKDDQVEEEAPEGTLWGTARGKGREILTDATE